MRKPRYAVYDTETNEYLQEVLLPFGSTRVRVTRWTRHPKEAQRFPGIKSAQAMVDALGNDSNIVILNGKGVIVG